MKDGELFFFIDFDSVLGAVLEFDVVSEELKVVGGRVRVGHVADK